VEKLLSPLAVCAPASLLAALGWLAATPLRAAEPGAATDVVRRTTLIVHDAAASIRFYRDVLGYELWLDNPGKVTARSLPSNARPGDPSRFAIMRGRHPWIGMIGLLQYGAARDAPGLDPRRVPKRLRPGDAVLMIETQDLDGIYSRMQRAGTPIFRAPESSEVTGAGGARWTARFLFAWDPDGHLLEINERLPALVATTAGAVTVRRGFFEARSGQLHYRRAIPAQAQGQRPPIVLLHQSPLSGRMFSELLPVLAADRVVYAPDTPGYGESAATPTVPTVADYGAALHDFIADLREPVDLVGYHTGALLAAHIAASYPHSIRRVVLISYPLFSPERRAQLRTDAPLSADGAHLLAEWRSTLSVKPEKQTLEQAARIVAEKQRAGTRAGWAMAAVAQYDPTLDLAAIGRPTLLLRPKDGLWDAAEIALRMIPGAQLRDAPDWGYGLFDAYPQEVSALLRDFLDKP
jgi:pimeloyl-ACP methyl ester carboxylesterase/catechol 2,3-dioxygenase-like lactoylglutathione lyase family enzyme